MSKTTEAIILAGGLGTRLRSVVSEVPKCMAPINGIPFLHFVISQLQQNGVQRFILALGYKSDVVIDYVNQELLHLDIDYVIEDSPLGTGGAIQLACTKVNSDDVIVVNGDTIFDIDVQELLRFHKDRAAACTIALKEMHAFSRYGSVNIDAERRLLSFNEKQYFEKGLINGGVYALNRAALQQAQLPPVFSFEKDYMETFINTTKMYGVPFNSYFIDIGIPEDYQTFINNHAAIMDRHPKENEDAMSTFFNFLPDFISNI